MPLEGRFRSLLERPTLLFTLYGTLVAAIAFAFTHATLLVNDGNVYMEMARAMRHGSLEIANGLDVVDSRELWITHSVKRGLHLYAKYPPLYGVVAAVPFALFGLRGLYLVNAAALALAFPAFHLLARRILAPSRAKLATLLLPFGTPVVAFALMELPHLVAMTLVLWAAVLWDQSRLAGSEERAAWAGLAAGLLAGFAVGVRLQDVFVAIPLVAGSAFARRRGASVVATSAGFLVCIGIICAFNVARFGSPNPFSYGPAEAFGAPADEERPGYFLRPALFALALIGLVAVLAARRMKSARHAVLVVAGAGALVASLPSVREAAVRTLTTMASMTVNASIAGDGWESPYMTSDWMSKALVVGAPLLALGLVAVVRAVARPAPPLQTVLAWMALLLFVFLSQRDPDPRSGIGVVGFFSLSPRYLVEAMPIFYLLAWWLLAEVRLTRTDAAIGALAAAVLVLGLWWSGPCDRSPVKIAFLTNAPIVLGALLVTSCALARRGLSRALGPLVALAHAVAFACVVAEDGRALAGFGSIGEKWGEQFLAVTPEKVAVVGWQFAKDPVFHVRALRDVVTVDASVDDGASLADTLDAFVADGRAAVYFGLGIERCAASLAGRYRTVPLLSDPIVYRLEPIASDAHGLSSREPAPARRR
ncbi:MAG: hypothetical protein ACLQVI_33140 [Polyangiaceae bacterium]